VCVAHQHPASGPRPRLPPPPSRASANGRPPCRAPSLQSEAGSRLFMTDSLVPHTRPPLPPPYARRHSAIGAPLLSSIIRLQPRLPTSNTSSRTNRSSSRRTLSGISTLSPELQPAVATAAARRRAPSPATPSPNSGHQ
jgi:hypothetical protein